MSWRSLHGAQERLRNSEERLVQEFAELVRGSAQSHLTPDPPSVCPDCHGQVPPREMLCPHCGHDFAEVAPEVAKHARTQAQAESGFFAWLHVWSQVLAMIALVVLALLHAPGTVLVALGVLVTLLPGAASLLVIPLALAVLPWAYLHGPVTILAILTFCAWRAGARFLQRPMFTAEPLAAAAVTCVALTVVSTGMCRAGWIDYPSWCARVRLQSSDRGAVASALGMNLPDTVSLVRVQSPGRPWPTRPQGRLSPVLYDMQIDARNWPALSAAGFAPRALPDEEPSPGAPRLSDMLAFSGNVTARDQLLGEGPSLTVCRRDDALLLVLDADSSPTLHLYLALAQNDR